jgi:hypothetical protein
MPPIRTQLPTGTPAVWSLSGGKQTRRGQPNSVEVDPQRTSALLMTFLLYRNGSILLAMLAGISLTALKGGYLL